MSEGLPQPQKSEEVDLGQLFKLIGNAFDRFFSFIGSIFKGAFNFLILFLLFIQKYFVKFLVIILVGLILGILVDIKKEPRFISTMLVEPNFNSAQQLYNNINFYNELAKAEDSVALAEALSISQKEAKSIKEFTVKGYANKNQKLKLFDNFVSSLDTITRKSINPEQYFNNFDNLDLRFHIISVISVDNSVAKKIEPTIIKSINRNDFFSLQKNVSDANIKLQDIFYTKQIAEIDSLQDLYKRVMLKEVDRSVTGTNISLGADGSKENKEFVLINKIEEIQTRLVALNVDRANKSNIINVISNFPTKGLEEKEFSKSYKFIIPAVLVSLSFMFFLLFSLNKYLKNYRKE